ncbi:hypothetical protein [Thauera sp. Sel9]|uniref:hypothetical protein n=1 Tax=Thauera sp. Sel9 TaxID=2974299 RepID=UPI0021E134F5|nr:hypothetical protein [Thauera sp. Sel9]MCV2219848.1 hypothetical protein [Thauera sp. Sel9]
MSRPLSVAGLIRFALRVVIAILASLIALWSVSTTHAQTSPAHGPIRTGDDMPMLDFLALLHQIAPAAAEGAKIYLGAVHLRCGRTLNTLELRQALAHDGGEPVLMGLIRASQQQDAAARVQLVRQIHCPTGAPR